MILSKYVSNSESSNPEVHLPNPISQNLLQKAGLGKCTHQTSPMGNLAVPRASSFWDSSSLSAKGNEGVEWDASFEANFEITKHPIFKTTYHY